MIDGIKLAKKLYAGDGVAVVAIFLYSLFIWWPSRYLPYFWDSSGYVIQTARDFLEQNFSNLASTNTNFPHPPLFTASLALVWKFFGATQLNSHLLMFGFLPLYGLGVYYLVKHYTNRSLALFATSLALFSPAVLAEYVNIYVDLPSAALAVAALALVVHKKNMSAWIVFTLAVMVKIPIITLAPFLFFNSTKTQKVWLSLPVIAILAWLDYHFRMNGWWLVEPGRSMATPTSLADAFSSIQYVFTTFFFDQGKYAWAIVASAAILFSKPDKQKLTQAVQTNLGFISSFVLSLGLFVLTAEFSPRYALYFIPLYALLVARALYKVTLTRKLNSVILLITMVLTAGITTMYWRGSTKTTSVYEYNAPTDLSILDSITSFRQMAGTLQVIAPKAKVYGGFPESQMLTEPIQGYVTKPLDFYNCSDFQYDPYTLQIVIIHPYAPTQIPCRLLMDQQKLLPINRFENNGKWVELYQVDATTSASPSAKK